MPTKFGVWESAHHDVTLSRFGSTAVGIWLPAPIGDFWSHQHERFHHRVQAAASAFPHPPPLTPPRAAFPAQSAATPWWSTSSPTMAPR
jgi:hypothetical protein